MNDAMIPSWLHLLALAMLAAGVVSALVLLADVVRRPQKMGIMNVVWPITGLYAGPLGLWGYYTYGRASRPGKAPDPHASHDHHAGHEDGGPFFAKVGKGATHCGAGCTLGDVVAETLVALAPGLAAVFGYGTIFGERIFAVWVLDFVLALAFGIVFQYAAVRPMNPDMSVSGAFIAAAKADTLSLTAWQVGMYGAMAILYFAVFRGLLGVTIDAGMVEFWASMQLAMIAGFCTAYPMNWLLIEKGIKEAM